TTVSREALEEAGVIKEEREPLTLRQWIVRGVAVVVGLGLLVGVPYTVWVIVNGNAQEQAVLKALSDVKAVKDKKPLFRPETQAEVNRAAGEYYLNTNRRRCVDKANDCFRTARQLLANSQSSYERDAALIDLAVSQVELGGDGKDVDNGERLTWKDAPTELRQ